MIGCGGGGGDAFQPPTGQVGGNGLNLADLNNPSNPRPSETEDINITGTKVVAIDRFDETGDGSSAGNIYVQDLLGKNQPYSGITVFAPSFSPPSLRIVTGDVVDVRGRYDEFRGPVANPFEPGESLPEIVGGTLSLRFDRTPDTMPSPIDVNLEDLVDYDTGRQWIGMLVRLKNVRIQADAFKSDAGRWSANLLIAGQTAASLPRINNGLFAVDETGLEFTKGAIIEEVVGVVNFFYAFSISPRSAADIKMAPSTTSG